jgi:hypothetical protein
MLDGQLPIIVRGLELRHFYAANRFVQSVFLRLLKLSASVALVSN